MASLLGGNFFIVLFSGGLQWHICVNILFIMDEINLYNALEWMRRQKKPFRIAFVKTNLTLQTGGDVRVIDQALVGANQKNKVEEHMIGFKDAAHPDNPPIHTYIYSLCYVNGKKITI